MITWITDYFRKGVAIMLKSVMTYGLLDIQVNDIRIIDVMIFIVILAITIILARKIPSYMKTYLLKKIGARFRHDTSLRDLPTGEKRKSVEYFKLLIDSFTRLLFWGILLIGLLAASVGANINIYETTGYHEFRLSIINIARFFSIILISLFLSRSVPIWLVSILDTFVRNLIRLKDREGSREEGEESDKQSDQAGPLTEYFTTFLRWCILIVGFVYAIATLGLEPDSSIHVLNENITVAEIVNAILTVIITIVFVIYLLPKILNRLIFLVGEMYSRRPSEEKDRIDFIQNELERVKPALHRTLVYLSFLLGFLVLISYLPVSYPVLPIIRGVTKAMIVLAIAFILTILTPFIIYTQSQPQNLEKKSNIYQIGRYINYLILLIASITIIGVIGLDLDSSVLIGESQFSGWGFITSILVIIITVIIGKMIVAMMRDTLLHPDHIDKHASQVLEKLIFIIILLIGITISLGSLGVNVFAVITGLGLIGFALAFGMQDTIANFVAGIMIAVERPFKIGDYIRVGDEWGHVIEIGMRSTKILTVQNEVVTIPNNLIATGEVWNFTRNNPLYVVKIPIGISYDSNWHLADDIILKAALSNDRILNSPEPNVRMVNFGDSSINLELVAWITHAKFREDVRSDILKIVKDEFDGQGVEIPYPYRTIVFKKDMIGEKEKHSSKQDPGNAPIEN